MSKATSRKIQKTTVYILDIATIYIYCRQTWLFIKMEFIIQVLKSFIIFHKTLKIVVGEVKNCFVM